MGSTIVFPATLNTGRTQAQYDLESLSQKSYSVAVDLKPDTGWAIFVSLLAPILVYFIVH
jgi:hypothetical protein